MENLYIEKSERSPDVNFKIDGNLFLGGESYPEDTHKFYTDIFNWLEEFVESRPDTITFTFQLIYFNSSSSKMIYEIFDLLEDANSSVGNLKILWKFNIDDDTMEEYGEEFQEDFPNLDIQLESFDS